MARGDTRYQPIEQLWRGNKIPPCTRIEAERAVKRLLRRFGRKELGEPHQLRDVPLAAVYTSTRHQGYQIPRDYISLTGGREDKGWPNLVHSLSHVIWRYRCPRLPPHHIGHAHLETEMTQYVLDQGWLNRTLLPKKKARPKGDALRQVNYAKAQAMVRRWEARAKLARTKLRKWKAKVRRYTPAPVSRETSQEARP